MDIVAGAKPLPDPDRPAISRPVARPSTATDPSKKRAIILSNTAQKIQRLTAPTPTRAPNVVQCDLSERFDAVSESRESPHPESSLVFDKEGRSTRKLWTPSVAPSIAPPSPSTLHDEPVKGPQDRCKNRHPLIFAGPASGEATIGAAATTDSSPPSGEQRRMADIGCVHGSMSHELATAPDRGTPPNEARRLV